MKTIVRALLVLILAALPSPLAAQADSARAASDAASYRVAGNATTIIAVPVGIHVRSGADTAAFARKEYHGGRWTVVGAVAGGLVGGGATAYVANLCATPGDCRGAWRWVVIGSGVGAIVGGFLTGLVYGFFNG